MMRYVRLLGVLSVCGGCVVLNKQIDPTQELAEAKVRPGITVLVNDSIYLIRGKRIGLLTNQTGVDEKGNSDIDVLRDKKARQANVSLVQLFSPEHGLRGTEDRQNIANGVDAKSGLPVFSLYGQQTMAPPDSVLRKLDALVFDLQDIGTRTWTYVGAMV
ncbi:MAG TPA: exo-beta-N-acetylmuramidase NamZ domain-containing protein, partial [Gemmatimonadaceae bacterium]|nr:exo-beta-N-acetylmuramidase NamZ domain-containing protein [Gemmatimonadaceae bacterium]